MPDCLIEKRDDGVALITLNRPESLNAMGGDLVHLLAAHLADCATDPDVRCVALTGAGRAFCAGGDVRNMQRRNDGQPVENEPQATPNLAVTLQAQTDDLRWRQDNTSLRLHTMPKPTVALVNGHAVGAGLGLALACDLRIASVRAKFGTAFRNVGLSGDFGSSYFLPRLVGMGKARELFFTAEVLDAHSALAIGMVNRVIDGDGWLEEALAFCSRLAAGPTAAYGRMKANLNLAETARLPDVLDQEALFQRISGLTDDSREAVRAFLEKREPVFRGR